MSGSDELTRSCQPGSLLIGAELATFGMGCFWSPEALFGHLPGVVRTCTGYAGGTAPEPTYRQMGDHTETVQITFDPAIISFGELLEVFWNNHNPVNINEYKGRQYQSLLFYSNEGHKAEINRILRKREALGKSEPATEIVPASAFHLAEDRHQKYYLKRFQDAMDKLDNLFGSQAELQNSTLAARLNGLAKGYTNMERIVMEVRNWRMEPSNQERLIACIKEIKW
ncbi:peptide-methionine (S)-S-oxide reductase MsrA [Paenibacillus sinopodophylli]|uniref:peptide-methionine (S)-S-oxide reductase MsrA n=1 Tax=Paenibacillus sinopodophylli TaxID=1837342 RepID=UPI00110CBF71|nr:peptide-methionine (S)-S-oxide reductase MsrA [Paenibacillus sinopodophylli]